MGEYVFAAVSILGALTITGLSINHLLKDSNYQVLKREGFVPIKERKDPAWRILIDKHTKEGHPKMGTNLREEGLFEWCEEILMANHSPQGLKESKKWCTKPKSNGETIKENRTQLKEIGPKEDDKWESKVQEYSK